MQLIGTEFMDSWELLAEQSPPPPEKSLPTNVMQYWISLS